MSCAVSFYVKNMEKDAMLSKYSVVLLATPISILLYIILNFNKPVLYFVIYGFVVATVFLTVSLPVSLLADTIISQLVHARWIAGAFLQVMITFLVLTPLLFIPLFLLFINQSNDLNFVSFISYSSVLWKPALINSLLYWFVDMVVQFVQNKNVSKK